MTPTRRRLLRGGLSAGLASVAGCASGFGDRTACTTGRTLHDADVTLPDRAAWSAYQYDAGNSGYNPEATGPKGDVSVAWRYSACTEAEAGVVVRDGRAFAGGLVVDGQTGSPNGGEWHGHMSTPAVDEGTLFVSTVDLEARDPETGAVTWTFQTDEDAGALPPPTVADGTVYVPGGIGDPTIYAVDAADGTERWRHRTASEADVPVAFGDGLAFALDESGMLSALDARTGDAAWTRSLDGAPGAAPVLADGRLYVGSADGGVRALDPADGGVVWRQREAPAGPVAAGGGTVFVSGRESVAALDAATGEERWRTDGLGTAHGPPAADVDTVYVGGRSRDGPGAVVALDVADGTERWRVETRQVQFGDYARSGVNGAPAVVDGAVYVATAPGDLYAITA